MKAKRKRKAAQKGVGEGFYVPDNILITLKDYFPEVDLSQVEWSWEVPCKIYEAEFVYTEQEYEVEITVTGHLLQAEVAISPEEIPDKVRQAMRKLYPTQSIDEVERVEYSNGLVAYEIELEKGEKEREVLFREDGLFIGEVSF